MNSNTTPEWRSRLDQAVKRFQSDYWPKIKRGMTQTADQLGQVDAKLEQTKYGDRYVTLKQEVNSAKASYVNTKTKVKMGYTDATSEASAEPYPRAAKVGEAVAKTEISLRQRLKDVLQSIVDKL